MSDTSKFKFFYVLSFAWQLGFLIVFPILGFGVGGSYLDKHFGTHGGYTLGGLLLGVGISIYETINMVKPIINKK